MTGIIISKITARVSDLIFLAEMTPQYTTMLKDQAFGAVGFALSLMDNPKDMDWILDKWKDEWHPHFIRLEEKEK